MPIDNVYAEKRLPSTLRLSWHHFYRDTGAMIGLYGFGTLLLLCLLLFTLMEKLPGRHADTH